MIAAALSQEIRGGNVFNIHSVGMCYWTLVARSHLQESCSLKFPLAGEARPGGGEGSGGEGSGGLQVLFYVYIPVNMRFLDLQMFYFLGGDKIWNLFLRSRYIFLFILIMIFFAVSSV